MSLSFFFSFSQPVSIGPFYYTTCNRSQCGRTRYLLGWCNDVPWLLYQRASVPKYQYQGCDHIEITGSSSNHRPPFLRSQCAPLSAILFYSNGFPTANTYFYSFSPFLPLTGFPCGPTCNLLGRATSHTLWTLVFSKPAREDPNLTSLLVALQS